MPQMLFLGSSGPEVEVLHQLLIEQGFDPGSDEWTVPRTFGPETEEAVRYFQETHLGPAKKLLRSDGVVGPATWWALEHPSGDEQDSSDLDLAYPEQGFSNPVAAAAMAAAVEEYRRGVFEVPDGSNRGPRIDLYTGFVGKPSSLTGPAWCAYFASWCFSSAPGGSPFGRQGNSQAIAAYCERRYPGSVARPLIPGTSLVGRIKPGDVGIIPNGAVRGHTTMILSVSGDHAWSVEGNSGNRIRIRRRPASQYGAVVNFDAYARDRKI